MRSRPSRQAPRLSSPGDENDETDEMIFDLVFLAAGAGALLAAVLPRILTGRAFSLPLVFLGAGRLVRGLRAIPLGQRVVLELHIDFLHCLELNPNDKIIKLNVLVNRLPRPNRVLLQALSEFLLSIVNNADVNKMNVRNGELLPTFPYLFTFANIAQSASFLHLLSTFPDR